METAILNKYPCVGKYLCARPTLKHVLLRKFGRYSILLSQDIVRRHSASLSLSLFCACVCCTAFACHLLNQKMTITCGTSCSSTGKQTASKSSSATHV
jgi:hypothetical protein